MTKETGLSPEATAHLQAQLVKLGDMIGDGLHEEPGGRQITSDYNRILKALGLLPSKPRRNNGAAINAAMAQKLQSAKCQKCGGELKQRRSGSLRADCLGCGAGYQFKPQKSRSAK